MRSRADDARSMTLDLSTAGRRLARSGALAAFGTLAGPLVVGAQAPTVSADLGLNSAYVWRGLTSTNRFVLEPELSLSIPLRAGTAVAFGAWANAEPTHYDGPRDISELGGARGPVVTSSQLWLEATRTRGESVLTLGATRYLYPNVGDLAAVYTTTEVYAVASVPTVLGVALAPTLSAYVDLEAVGGAYVEGALSRAVAVPVGARRRLPLSFGAALGWSIGQSAPDRAEDVASYFAREGVTHVDLSAGSEITVGGVSVAPVAHYILGRDPLARVTAPDESRRAKLWVGATLSWSAPIRRRRATVAVTPDSATRVSAAR